MLATVYTMSFAASLGGLIAWFYYQDQPKTARLASKAFVGGFGVYLFSLAFADGALGAKLFILFRDFMVLSVVALFFNVIKQHIYIFVAGLVLLYGGFKLGYSKVMMKSFEALSTAPMVDNNVRHAIRVEPPTTFDQLYHDNIPLAPKGEFLVELQEGKVKEDLSGEFFMYGFSTPGRTRQAFSPEDIDATTLDNFIIVDAHSEKEIKSLEQFFKKQTDIIAYYEFNELVELPDLSDLSADNGIDRSSYYANDPGLNQSWSFKNLDINQLHLDINEKKIKPKKKALIAILDTGVDANHEDLKGRYRSLGSKNDKDAVSHGTHCAGIAAAVSNNGKGIASMSPNNDFVEVTSIKVLNDFGGGTQGTIVNGILKAADAGADVISMSLGGRSNPSRQRAYNKAVEYANKKGAIVVVAAGNSNMNAKNYAPANAKGVIAVSATDIESKRASFSNTVQDVGMGIAAPGVNIYSTTPSNTYKSFNGTSMAAPHVAGLIGMMKSIFPEMTTEDAYFILEKTGGSTDDNARTGKLIQPVKAINYLTKMD